jgi:hypothetical protein
MGVCEEKGRRMEAWMFMGRKEKERGQGWMVAKNDLFIIYYFLRMLYYHVEKINGRLISYIDTHYL